MHECVLRAVTTGLRQWRRPDSGTGIRALHRLDGVGARGQLPNGKRRLLDVCRRRRTPDPRSDPLVVSRRCHRSLERAVRRVHRSNRLHDRRPALRVVVRVRRIVTRRLRADAWCCRRSLVASGVRRGLVASGRSPFERRRSVAASRYTHLVARRRCVLPVGRPPAPDGSRVGVRRLAVVSTVRRFPGATSESPTASTG